MAERGWFDMLLDIPRGVGKVREAILDPYGRRQQASTRADEELALQRQQMNRMDVNQILDIGRNAAPGSPAQQAASQSLQERLSQASMAGSNFWGFTQDPNQTSFDFGRPMTTYNMTPPEGLELSGAQYRDGQLVPSFDRPYKQSRDYGAPPWYLDPQYSGTPAAQANQAEATQGLQKQQEGRRYNIRNDIITAFEKHKKGGFGNRMGADELARAYNDVYAVYGDDPDFMDMWNAAISEYGYGDKWNRSQSKGYVTKPSTNDPLGIR